jgi:hypothetical protein
MSVTEGKASGGLINRSSIVKKDKIPNSAIFLKRTALEFLQVIFSNRAEGSFRYDEDDTRTEIQISDVHATDFAKVAKRPAIVAVRGPMSWQGTGLGGGAVESRTMSTGSTRMNDLLTGSIAFSCISREGIEAEQLAYLVFNSFKFFRPVLQKYGFFTIKSMNIGAESMIEAAGPEEVTVVVPVYVTAQVQDRWRLDESVARLLEKVVLETLTQDARGE